MNLKKYIPIKECKDGYLYLISARHAFLGIYQNRAFFTRRIKFDNILFWPEYHWNCKTFATAKPYKELEKCPFEMNDREECLLYLKDAEERYNKDIEFIADNFSETRNE